MLEGGRGRCLRPGLVLFRLLLLLLQQARLLPLRLGCRLLGRLLLGQLLHLRVGHLGMRHLRGGLGLGLGISGGLLSRRGLLVLLGLLGRLAAGLAFRRAPLGGGGRLLPVGARRRLLPGLEPCLQGGRRGRRGYVDLDGRVAPCEGPDSRGPQKGEVGLHVFLGPVGPVLAKALLYAHILQALLQEGDERPRGQVGVRRPAQVGPAHHGLVSEGEGRVDEPGLLQVAVDEEVDLVGSYGQGGGRGLGVGGAVGRRLGFRRGPAR